MEFARKGKEMTTISKKQERKPPFFQGGPPSSRGASTGDMEEAEPKTSVTRNGLTKGKANPRQPKVKESELIMHVLPYSGKFSHSANFHGFRGWAYYRKNKNRESFNDQ